MAEAASPLIYGCYLLVVRDEGRTYAMVCSWASQVSDRYAILCLGAQSGTGRAAGRHRVLAQRPLARAA